MGTAEASLSERSRATIALLLDFYSVGVGREGQGGGGGGRPNNLRGGPTYPLPYPPPPPNNPSTFFVNFYVKQEKITKLKGKIIINVTLI